MPAKKRLLHKSLGASRQAETRYVSDLQRIMRGVHSATRTAIKPFLEDLEEEPGLRHRRDASVPTVRSHVKGTLTTIEAALKVHVARHVGDAFDRMASVVDKKNRAGLRLISITPHNMGAENVLKRARDSNIQLIEDAGRDYVDDVRDIFEDEENFGASVKDLTDKLWDKMQEREGVSLSRAQLIARDQTLKTNSALTRDRYQKAGVSTYKWSTSLDERVRPMHAELEGQTFSFDDPPVTNEDGDTNNPGEDFQCRCLSLLPEEEEEEEDT